MSTMVFVVIYITNTEGFHPVLDFILWSLSLYNVEALLTRMRFLRGLLGHVTNGRFSIHTTRLLIICWYARG